MLLTPRFPSEPLAAGTDPLAIIGDDTTDVVAGALFRALELRDVYTARHMREVSELATAISVEVGYEGSELHAVQMGALLHDIGKIGTPLEFLTKPGRLSVAEHEVIKAHASAGAHIVDDVRFPDTVRSIVVQHHERLDGSGYPDGLRAEQISREARIVMVADVVGAMSCPRPYRRTPGVPAALTEIERGSGEVYDPEAVEACLRLFHDGAFRF